MFTARLFSACVVCLALSVVGTTVQAQPAMSCTRIVSGLVRPVFVTTAPGDPDRLFIVEQRSGSTGRIQIFNLNTGMLNAQPFLSIGGLATSSEQGLLGLAFHPDYQKNDLFYVNYTSSAGGGDTRIVEYARTTADLADAASARTLMTINQPFSNHNGGWMEFGPIDELLYIGTGDGGSGGDPQNNAQTISNNLLGKILRIDPLGDNSGNGEYGIPGSNPFVGTTGDDEIWAYGLRNPWRCCFDSLTGDLYIGDVGQNAREEIDVQPAADSGGTNYGWRDREGTNGPALAGAIDPIYDYAHGGDDNEGFSVTGGCVYRGPLVNLQGRYFFSDYVTDRVWSLNWDGSAPSTHNGTNFTSYLDWTDQITTDIGSISNISSYGEDSAGNLYIVDLGGEVFRVDSATLSLFGEGQKLTDGETTNGGIGDLQESDDVYQEIDPSPTINPLKQRVQMLLLTTASSETPSALSFQLEAKMIGGPSGDVIQTIELLNYQTGQFELIDTRAATIADDLIEFAVGGDPTRFVQPASKELTALIRWVSEEFSGDPFTWSVDVDLARWRETYQQ